MGDTVRSDGNACVQGVYLCGRIDSAGCQCQKSQVIGNPGKRSTREEHRARMSRAEEMLFKEGWTPSQAIRSLAAQENIGARQAARYVHTVRKLYAQAAAMAPSTSTDELLLLLRARSAQSVAGEEPDWKASAKFLELEARIRGLLDQRTRLTVEGTITHQHVPALEAASEEELAALAAFHAARERRLAAEDAGAPVAGQLPALATTGD